MSLVNREREKTNSIGMTAGGRSGGGGHAGGHSGGGGAGGHAGGQAVGHVNTSSSGSHSTTAMSGSSYVGSPNNESPSSSNATEEKDESPVEFRKVGLWWWWEGGGKKGNRIPFLILTGLNDWAIAGIVIGSVVFLLIVCFVVYKKRTYLKTWYSKRKESFGKWRAERKDKKITA